MGRGDHRCPGREVSVTARSRRPPSAAHRVAEVLDSFVAARSDLGVSEIARSMNCSKSVVHRILAALVDTGYVASDPITRRYRLGAKAVLLSGADSARDDIRRRALPHLEAVRQRTGETATLSLLRGGARVYVEQLESRQAVRQAVTVGSEAPLHLGASGKAMLAFLAEERWPATARGSGLRADLMRVRRRGYAVSHGERIPGAASVAAPIFDRAGGVLGSLSAAGVLARSDPRTVARYGAAVTAEAQALSRELGWRGRAKP